MNPGSLRSLLVARCVLSTATPTEWKVIRAGRRDYVTLRKRRGVLPFADYSHANRTISLRSAQRGIRAQVGTSELYINGVRFFTHFPLLEQAEGQLISAFDVGKIDRARSASQPHRNAQQIETVVLDPGHGGTDSGTANRWGSEKTFALEVAMTARENYSTPASKWK